MRYLDLTALLSLCAACALALWIGPSTDAAPGNHSVQWLDAVDIELSHHGILHRHDVSIKINNSEVARGFSGLHCDGLLLIAQLPNTSQGWHRIAPQVDMSRYETRYLFEGEAFEQVPVLPRLRSWLVSTLPGVTGTRQQVIALAETGHCGLLPQAISIVADVAMKNDQGRAGS
jgi:hypothetical protein